MRALLGLLLIIASFIGTLFFKNYNGTVISYPIIWYLAFLFSGLIGALLIVSSTKKMGKNLVKHVNFENERLKANSEKILVDFDKCEFKSGSFSHQVEDPNWGTARFFVSGPLSNIDDTVTEAVIQSYLVYTDTIDDAVHRFVSQSFPFDPMALKVQVLNNKVVLYVDRYDRNRYLFEVLG